MIIYNQTKTEIINFDSVSTIERNGHKISCYFKDSPCPLLLGDYPTNERAAKVLDEFFEYYSRMVVVDIRGTAQHDVYNYHQTFEMPEE